MSQSAKQKSILSYSDAVRMLNSQDVQADLDDACRQLAHSTLSLMETFDGLGKQLHTIDLQGIAPPLRPTWMGLRKEFLEILWQFRNIAGFISARLKMFCTVVLPLLARTPNGSSGRSHDEKLQVLQSYMGISADHAALTRTLVGNAAKFNAKLNSLHTEFAKFLSQHAPSSQRELRELSHKLTDLENSTKQLYIANGKLSGLDVTHFVYSTLRVCASKRRPSRSRFSHQKLALTGPELTYLAELYEQLERSRNEVAHAQYTAQVSYRKTDALSTAQTAMSTLVSEEILTLEVGLGFFLAIWSRLQCDCNEIMRWLHNPRGHPETPAPIDSLTAHGHTLYAVVVNALDAYVSAIDPSHFANRS